MGNLIRLSEPTLLFGHNQALEDPRDGLTLFGPLDEGKPYGIRAGVIGTPEGIKYFKKWVLKLQGLISADKYSIARPPFPGFEAVFRIPWSPQPNLEVLIQNKELYDRLYLDDKHQRVYKTVDLYEKGIVDAINNEEQKVDIWFVIVPDAVYKYCRPKSYVESDIRLKADHKMSPSSAKKYYEEPSLFEEDNITAIPYQYDVHFHNQLKARLLEKQVPTQVLRESTLDHNAFLDHLGRPTRNLDQLQSAIAWNVATSVFYKVGGRPWKIGDIRDGVCYIGIVFKRDESSSDTRMSCCAAQMFLDSGDGIVFKRAGQWYNPKNGEYHLSRNGAAELVKLTVKEYKRKKGCPPKELFIHGKVRFNSEEWKGFQSAMDASTNIVGIRIQDEKNFKLYRKGDHPVLRGLAYVRDERTAYLWTKGFIPRLQTYPGREVPKPLLIDICKGNPDIEMVLNDIMALTKLNYNTCIFADGVPVTLKFADAVGEILTAGPIKSIPPLPFWFYI